ncbi:galactosylceramide sulfotransferase-like isoform X2 [Branchiostoma floridae x Branchiostoma japonicum]
MDENKLLQQKVSSSKRAPLKILLFFLAFGTINIIYFAQKFDRSPQEKRLFNVGEWNSTETTQDNRKGTTGTQENRKGTEKAPKDTCSPQRKFVFIKTHKTGGCTIVNIFQRYAIRHKLSALLPAAGTFFPWHYPPAKEDYIHTPDEQYDVLMNHMRYNKTWLRTKFPANTAYISVLREPSSHLKSAMNYYNLPKLMKIKSKNPVQTFLQDPWKYKDLSEAYFDFCNVTWDGTRNFLSFDLGYPTEGAEDKERARQYISELEADFTLVLLLEHLDESLVLLRRLMCWEVLDVLYDMTPKNNRNYSYKKYVPSAEELANLRRWKAVDYLLYDTFNSSLWRKIAAQGPDFYDELHYFKEVKQLVSTHCKMRGKENLKVAASKWSPQFQVDQKLCRGMKAMVPKLLATMRKSMWAATKQQKGRKIVRIQTNILRIIHGRPTHKYRTHRKK